MEDFWLDAESIKLPGGDLYAYLTSNLGRAAIITPYEYQGRQGYKIKAWTAFIQQVCKDLVPLSEDTSNARSEGNEPANPDNYADGNQHHDRISDTVVYQPRSLSTNASPSVGNQRPEFNTTGDENWRLADQSKKMVSTLARQFGSMINPQARRILELPEALPYTDSRSQCMLMSISSSDRPPDLLAPFHFFSSLGTGRHLDPEHKHAIKAGRAVKHKLPQQPRTREDFRIAIICALPIEASMVEYLLDRDWSDVPGTKYGKERGDANVYKTGAMAGHNVVLAYMPDTGGNDAAAVASRLNSSFKRIEFAFVVGICGAVPVHHQTRENIVLGDCIISTAVIRYDFGKQHPGGFRKKEGHDNLGRASSQVRSLMAKWTTHKSQRDLNDQLKDHLEELFYNNPEIKLPSIENDRLFESTYLHTHSPPCENCLPNMGICELECTEIGCDDRFVIERQRQPTSNPRVHFGCFGSANAVMKSGKHRDAIAKSDKIVAFEMEGSGVWDVFPTIVIKSACDYADSHKNGCWQEYAAASAAATLKAVLSKLELADDELVQRVITPQIVRLGQNWNSGR